MSYKTRGVYSFGGGDHFKWCKCPVCNKARAKKRTKQKRRDNKSYARHT